MLDLSEETDIREMFLPRSFDRRSNALGCGRHVGPRQNVSPFGRGPFCFKPQTRNREIVATLA